MVQPMKNEKQRPGNWVSPDGVMPNTDVDSICLIFHKARKLTFSAPENWTNKKPSYTNPLTSWIG